MRLFIVLVAGLLSTHLSFGQNLSEVSNTLKLVKDEFLTLGNSMPYESVLYGRDDELRDRFGRNNEALASALSRVEVETPAKMRDELTRIHYEYRWIGMVMPFYAVKKEKQADIIQRYLSAEDSLARSIRTLGLLTVTPTPTNAWRYKGLVWVGFGKMPLPRAQEDACNTLAKTVRGANGWHVPEFHELAGVYADIKDPKVNQVFGEQAASWREVWTSTQNQTNPGFFDYIDFQTGKTGAARQSEPYQIVCVGKDNT